MMDIFAVCRFCQQQATMEASHWERYVLRHVQGDEFEPCALIDPICPGCIDEFEWEIEYGAREA